MPGDIYVRHSCPTVTALVYFLVRTCFVALVLDITLKTLAGYKLLGFGTVQQERLFAGVEPCHGEIIFSS